MLFLKIYHFSSYSGDNVPPVLQRPRESFAATYGHFLVACQALVVSVSHNKLRQNINKSALLHGFASTTMLQWKTVCFSLHKFTVPKKNKLWFNRVGIV